MSNDECWRPENAISAHSATRLFNLTILDILVLGLEITIISTSFSM